PHSPLPTLHSPLPTSSLAPSITEPIAIIGMSGRFPQAYDIEQMWAILAEGRCAVEEIPAHYFDWHQYYGDPRQDSTKTNGKWCATIPGVAEFDPLFFQISPREAPNIDPRQRHLLQESWNALENAGYGPDQISSQKIGTFVGAEEGDYCQRVKDGNITSNHSGILAARLAYFLNLKGPTMAINTACSSALVATHQACLSLRQGECDAAIAAGVNLMLTPYGYVGMAQAGMLSDDGHCYAFDQQANGLVPGEAVVVVVLKRLSRALADGDPIHALIPASGVNYDGKTNGITAPNGVSQTELVREVQQRAQVSPQDIDYIVTHGTGTKLGDPVEANALRDVFKGSDRPCAITSSKTNFGHTFAASGLVSLVNVVQALRHQTIPKSLNFSQQNSFITWEDSPLYVNTANQPWPVQPGQKRLGAVSSFGMSGTNAHMLIQDYQPSPKQPQTDPPYSLLVLSAKTEESLRQRVTAMVEFLQTGLTKEITLTDIGYTLFAGRHHCQYRLAIVVQDLADALYTWTQFGQPDQKPNVFQGKVPTEFRGQTVTQNYINQLVQTLAPTANSPADDPTTYQETLFGLADFYCQGYDIPWSQLYGDQPPKRIHLPGYPFARQTFWLDFESEQGGGAIAPHIISPLTEATVDLQVGTTSSTSSLATGRTGMTPLSNGELRGVEPNLDLQPKLSTQRNPALYHQLADLSYLPIWEQQAPTPVNLTSSPVVLLVYFESTSKFEQTLIRVLQQHGTVQILEIQLGSDTKQLSACQWHCNVNAPNDLRTCLSSYTQTINGVYFVGGDRKLQGSDPTSEIQLLRLVQVLQSQLQANALIDFTILTLDNYRVDGRATVADGGGLSGLGYALAQGDHRFRVRNLDLCWEDWADEAQRLSLVTLVLSEPPSNRGEVTQIQAGLRYKLRFFKLDWASFQAVQDQGNGLAIAGVYVILGGAGTVGTLLSRYLIQHYQAQVIWLGRSESTAPKIQAQLATFRALDAERVPLYIQADVTDATSMTQAVQYLKQHYPRIHGAIFSAMVFKLDNAIAQTSEADFNAVFTPKQNGAFNFYEAFKNEPLDFMCYLSSVQAFSFLSARDSAGYAAGITSADTFVHSVATTAPFPVGVINWGYWQASLAGTEMEKRLASHYTLISDDVGCQFFADFVSILRAGLVRQVICLGASQAVQTLMGCDSSQLISLNDAAADSVIHHLFRETEISGGPTTTNSNQVEIARLLDREFRHELNDWLSRLLFAQIQSLGIFSQPGIQQDSTTWQQQAGIIAKYNRWWQECCLGLLETYGYVTCEGDRVTTINTISPAEVEQLWQNWSTYLQSFTDNPEKQTALELLDSCLQQLPQILRGHIQATDILFPKSSMEKVENMYQRNALSDYFNTFVAQGAEAYVRQRMQADPQAQIRILEVGAGTGGTTALV
ncbi:MAG: SDR family NAD(P)-dependent oxidoreductase, partial [Leptolyngbyaceae bacterium]|nr:SDR family NAD(P)-dependent oxidoreductase [Leptolyngbyaceae bacterium]